MKTEINQVEVNDKDLLYSPWTPLGRPISVEAICNEFFGVIEISYLYNIHSNKIVVYVSTFNLGTINISELFEIQKKLNAESLSISIHKYKSLGIIYILSYANKIKTNNSIADSTVT